MDKKKATHYLKKIQKHEHINYYIRFLQIDKFILFISYCVLGFSRIFIKNKLMILLFLETSLIYN